MIRIKDVFKEKTERRLMLKTIISGAMAPIKAVFNVILGLLPPVIKNIITSPALMGSLMFYFVWYCIERIFFLKSLAALMNTEGRLKEYKKVIAKPGYKI